MTKCTASRFLALVNLTGAWEWHVVGLGIGASIISALAAGLFLYISVHRRRLKPLPAVGATPKQKAEYNLQRVALLVDAEEIPGGWQVRSGGETFNVYDSRITCKGKGQTCYQAGASMPQAEKTATALLFLHKYPQAWQFWASNHGVRWSPNGSDSAFYAATGGYQVIMG